MRVTRRMTVMLVLATAALAGIAGPASASATSVKQAVLAQDHILNTQPGFKIVLNERKYKKSQYRTIAPKIAALKPVLEHAASVVAAAQASGSKQRQGQKDWVSGARIEASAFVYLSKELIAVADGQSSLARQDQATGTTMFKKALNLARQGDKLLGLPASA